MRVTLRTPPLARQSGTTRWCVAVADAMRRAGVQVRVEQELHLEAQIGGKWVGGAVSARLGRLVPPRAADIVHAGTLYCNPTLRAADMVTIHDVMPIRQPELYGTPPAEQQRMLAKLRRALRRGHLHVSTQHVRSEVEACVVGADRDRIHVVPHGIEPDRFHPDVGPDPAIRRGRLNVVVVAQPERRKRVDLLLEAAQGLPFVDVIHVGATAAAGPHRAMAEQVARAAGPLVREGRYRHVGPVDDARLRRLLSNAGVVVAPSLGEGFGWPPLEALACGARVIASDIPAHREVLGDAVRYAAVDAATLRAELSSCWDGRAVRESQFAPLSARLERARAYTWERTVAGLLEAYGKVQATR